MYYFIVTNFFRMKGRFMVLVKLQLEQLQQQLQHQISLKEVTKED